MSKMSTGNLSNEILKAVTLEYPELSKGDRTLLYAYLLGYSADINGRMFAPDGKEIRGGVAKSGHKNFVPRGLNKTNRCSVLVHRFVAYAFFGSEVFNHQLVRHLNGIPHDNSVENLMPGSSKENRADIPREILVNNGKRNAYIIIEKTRKLSDEQVKEMRNERQKNSTPYRWLAGMFGVTAMTAYRAVNKQSWSNV